MKRLVIFLLLCSPVMAEQKSFESLVGKTAVGPVNDGPTQVPYITWGGDVATFVANGGLTTTKSSLYGKVDLNLKLVAGDDFKQQVQDYLSGKSPYLRGTVHMMSLASEVINKDPRTKPVVALQLTWSAGDHIVARENIKSLNDLKGKKVCLQSDGPHLGLVNDSLAAAGLKWTDITVVYVKDLTGPNGPAEAMRKDSSIDAACVISPDMIGLCGGLDQKGSGAEGTIKNSRVVNSTASMNHSIADVYVVRKDYYDKHRLEVERFVVGYLKATEDLLTWKKAYDDGKGKSPEYVAALKLAQKIYGTDVLPTIEADAHGLVSDATFVRIPGNENFLNDPNSLIGLAVKQKEALAMAANLGYIANQFGFAKADWDYKKISEAVGVKYVAPVLATGRIKAEVSNFGEDLDSNTIFSFEIKFESGESTFPVETYAADFMRVIQQSATFGNAVILVRGHSDPAMALQNFYWAAKAKGILTGEQNSLKFNGKSLELTDTKAVVDAIESDNFAGLKRKNKDGKMVSIDDPKETVSAALQLSQSRAVAVKKAVEDFAKSKNLQIDLSQIQPRGVGIAEPINPRPRNMQQAKENMRVEFRVVRVKAEVISEDSFDFDK